VELKIGYLSTPPRRFCRVFVRNGEVSGYGGLESSLKVLTTSMRIDFWSRHIDETRLCETELAPGRGLFQETKVGHQA
jgi:hypothetical protein